MLIKSFEKYQDLKINQLSSNQHSWSRKYLFKLLKS